MSAPRIDHVGIIVADLDKAMAMFERLFGDGPSVVKEVAEIGIRLAKFEAENVTIELIQYLADGPSLGKRVMGEEPGLNHLAARVEDMDQAIAELAGAGLTPMEGFPRPGAEGRIAFFEDRKSVA